MSNKYDFFNPKHIAVQPCPFCGNEDIVKWVDSDKKVYIGCPSSLCQFQIGGHLIPELNVSQQTEALIRLWNRRYKEDKLKQEIDKNKSLKDSYYAFCETYKIVTGDNYED